MSEYDEALKEREYKTNELTLGRDFYRKYLGLDFQRVDDDRLRFVFTKIDPNAFERQFVFGVFIDQHNRYQLVECEPRIDNTEALLDELNDTNNFSAFVQQIRAKFRATCF